MVSVVDTADEDAEDAITTCAKCRQLVTDPTTFPCLDSLCAECFRALRDTRRGDAVGTAACPRCRDPFQLPTSDLQTLPDRGFVDTMVLLQKTEQRNQTDDNSCDICNQDTTGSESVAAAERYCIECRQRMCAVCARRHPRCSSTKNHHLVDLGLDSANEMLRVTKSIKPVCAIHREIFAVAHCYQCSMGLCGQCRNLHGGHEIEDLTDDTYSRLTNTVKSLRDQLRQQLDACVSGRSRVQKLLLDRRNGIKSAKKSISDKADEMISLIQTERDDLLSVLHSRNEQSVSSLDAASAELLSGLSANKKALKFAEELLEKGSEEDVLLNCRMLRDRVTRLCNVSVGRSVPDDSINNDVSPASLIRDVCTSLDSHSKFCLI